MSDPNLIPPAAPGHADEVAGPTATSLRPGTVNDPVLGAKTRAVGIDDIVPTEPRTGLPELWRRMRHSSFFMIGAITFVVIVLICCFGPFLLPWQPEDSDIPSRLLAPEWFAHGLSGHILGTDALGRDVLDRMLVGGRTSLFVATTIVVGTTLFGLVLGLLAGYFGGVVDLLVMRLCDLGLAIPSLLLAVAVAAVIGGGVLNLIIVLSLTSWIMVCRVVRSTVIAVRNLEFVQAAKVFGLPNGRIIVREVLPNIVSPMIITATQAFGATVLSEASLSFLGLGIPDPAPSWGGMIAAGREYIATSPWVVVGPGLALMLAVLAFNYIGDGLNDVLNPMQVD